MNPAVARHRPTVASWGGAGPGTPLMARAMHGHHIPQVASSLVRSFLRLERGFFIDDQLVRIHLIMSEMFLVDRPRAMGV